jgi:hypothetical protein
MGHFEHPIHLGGPETGPSAAASRTGAPGLLAFDDTEFVAALEAEVSAHSWPAKGWPSGLCQALLGADGGSVRLFQPIHRRFSVALLDAQCERFGQPRLDPRHIAARGMVLRRYTGPRPAGAADLGQAQHWQAWRGTEAAPLGWRSLGPDTLDADPTLGPAPLRSGSAAVDRLLAQRMAQRVARSVARVADLSANPSVAQPLAAPERVLPLWPVNPTLSAGLGRTLLFGLVPTTMPVAVTPPAAEREAAFAALKAPEAPQRAQLQEWLSPWFQRSSALAPPRAGRAFDSSWLQQERWPEDEDRFVTFIEQIAYELDAFGAGAARWQPVLAQIPLWRLDVNILSGWRYRRMDSLAYFRAAAHVVRPELGSLVPVMQPDLIGPQPGFAPTAVQMAAWQAQLVDTAIDGFAAQEAAQPLPQAALDDDNALYAVRAFIRVKGRPGCPPELVWSEPSALFSIAPWYEGTGQATPPIPLPRLNRETLRKLKPSAGFSVPNDVRGLLRPNGAQAMLAGNPRRPNGGLDWVLQLSIPIMTVCALFAMTIVLTLLDAIYRWIPFAWILTPRLRK